MLGRSLDDLPPQTRRLLQLIDPFVTGECQRQDIPRADVRFSRRTLREALAWGDTQLKVHLARLAELEYLVVHRTKTNGFEYELVYDNVAEGGNVRFPGLADIDALAQAYAAARSGQNSSRSEPIGQRTEQDAPQSDTGRGAVGPGSAGSRDGETPAEPDAVRVPDDNGDECGKTPILPENSKTAPNPCPPSQPQAYDATKSGQTAQRSASGRGAVGPRSAGSRDGEKPVRPAAARAPADSDDEGGETHSLRGNSKTQSYPQGKTYTQVDIPFAAAGN